MRAVVPPLAAEVPGPIATVGLSRSCGGLVSDLVGSASDAIPPATGVLEAGRYARPIRRVVGRSRGTLARPGVAEQESSNNIASTVGAAHDLITLRASATAAGRG